MNGLFDTNETLRCCKCTTFNPFCCHTQKVSILVIHMENVQHIALESNTWKNNFEFIFEIIRHILYIAYYTLCPNWITGNVMLQ